jgi:tetratricopeptide (TPR) repeat protein
LSSAQDLPLHGVAIYNPDLLSKQELKDQFVARKPLLQRLMDDLGRDGSAQHHLLIGPRGMGKTTLLRRLHYAVEDDAKLKQRWLPLTFPEEQYNVVGLSDFYLNCIDALSDALERQGQALEARALDEAVSALPDRDEPARARKALSILLHGADRAKRRLLLLVDNIDLILERLKHEQWAIREVLSAESRLLLIGASSAMIESTYTYKEPFYDFFQLHELKGLDEQETREVMRTLARLGGVGSVERVLDEDPARIRTLHVLAGGNPRTVVLLYNVLARGTDGDVRSDLERLLDQCTPLYKARFEALPTQSQQIVDALAIHWDPISAGELAERVRLDTNAVSSQLNRLEKQGVVEKVAYHPSTKTGFQVAERFFNIWYLMRASRRVRQRLIWLVEFLKLLYGRDQVRHHAERHLRGEDGGDAESRLRQAEYGLALAEAIEDMPLKWALESTSMRALTIDRELRERLAGIVDLEGADASLKPFVDRHRAAAELKEAVFAAKVRWKGWSPGQFWELLGGSLSLTPVAKIEVAIRLAALTKRQVNEFLDVLAEEKAAWINLLRCNATAEALFSAVREGYMVDAKDVQGAEVAALTLEAPDLPAVALANCLVKTFDMDQVVFLRTYALKTRSAYPWVILGSTLQEHLRQYDDAETAYKKTIELDPTYARPWFGLGTLLQVHLRRYDDAEAAYRKAIELDPTSALPWNNLGKLLNHRLRRYEDAETAYRKATDLNPAFSSAWNSLAWLRYQTNKIDQVTEVAARRAVELAPDSHHALHTLATILAHRGNWSEAESLARRFLGEGSLEFHEKTWPDIITFFREAVRTGHAADALKLLDDLHLTERWRPLWEALTAITAGSKHHLLRVAPEVRKPAEELIDELFPQGLDGPPLRPVER